MKTYDWTEHRGIKCSDQSCARPVEEDYGIHSTYLLTQKSIEIISNHSSSDSPPFFLYLAYQAIHSPPTVPLHYVEMFNDSIQNPKRRLGAGMIYQMDEGIGNITAALKRHGMLENTVLIFTSDNGAAIGTGDGIGGVNWPLRGAKHSIWEGGTKVPALIHYPPLFGQGDGDGASFNYSFLFHSADWAPTFAAIAGIRSDALSADKKVNGSLLEMDGESHWRNLNMPTGHRQAVREWIYYGNDNPNSQAAPGRKFGLRYGRYKALFGGGGSPNLWMKYDEDTKAPEPVEYELEKEGPKALYGKKAMFRLYDLLLDPLETTNAYGSNEELEEIGDRIRKEKLALYGAKQTRHSINVGCLSSKSKGKPRLKKIKDANAKGVTWPC